MSQPFYHSIDDLYEVATGMTTPHDVDPELYDEDDDMLEYFAPSYINRLGREDGKRVIYWESDYNPSAYRLCEDDDPRCAKIFDALEDCGIEFNEILK